MDQEVGGRQIELFAQLVGGGAGIADPGRLLAHPAPGEGELVHLRGFDDRQQILQHRVRIQLDGLLDEAFLAQQLIDDVRLAVQRHPQ